MLVLYLWSPILVDFVSIVLWRYALLDIHRSRGFGSIWHNRLAVRVKSWVHAEDTTNSKLFLTRGIVVLALDQVRLISHLLFLLRWLLLWHCTCKPCHRFLLLVLLCEADSLSGPGRRWLVALATTSTAPMILIILRPIKGFSSDRVDLVYHGVKQLLISNEPIVLFLAGYELLIWSDLPLITRMPCQWIEFWVHYTFCLILSNDASCPLIHPILRKLFKEWPNFGTILDALDECLGSNLDQLNLHAEDFDGRAVVGDLLNRFDQAKGGVRPQHAHINVLYLFLLILGHVLGVLTVSEFGVLEDLLGIDFLEVRLVFKLLEILANWSFLHNVDIVGHLTLLDQFWASLLNFHLKLAGDILSLTEVKMFEDWNFLHFCLNLL